MFDRVAQIINRLKLDTDFISSGNCADYSPITGEEIASLPLKDAKAIETAIHRAGKAFEEWRHVDMKERCELIRLFGEELRKAEEEITQLIMIETGKIYSSAMKEVKRSIFLCESISAVSRHFSGMSTSSESKNLVVSETWEPLGPVAIITSFNFPIRVWVYNAILALSCGNPILWRPSRKATLVAYAVNELLRRAKARSSANCPEYLSQIVVCNHEESMILAESTKVPLLCATGSPVMARQLQSKVGQRLGRCILSIGGNNAAVIAPTADIKHAIHHVTRSTIVDCGQRGTSLQRLFCHSSIYDEVVEQLANEFNDVYVNSPFERKSQIGPLINKDGFDKMRLALDQAKNDGGIVHGGQRTNVVGTNDKAYYVQPAVIEMPLQTEMVKTEILSPQLFVMRYDDLDEAIAGVNAIPQTLVSCLFSNDLQETGYYSSLDGARSDAVAINVGTVGYDLMAMFNTDKNASVSEPWRPFMLSKINLMNYNFDSSH